MQCFESYGMRIWNRFLNAPVVGLAPGDAHSVVARQDRSVFVIDEKGGICSSKKGDRPILGGVCAWSTVSLLIGDIEGQVVLYCG